MDEIWKDVPGYEGLYMVSDRGRVKSLNYKRTGKEKVLRPVKNLNGYLFVTLRKAGKQKNLLVHRLVYEAFRGPIPGELQVNHLNEVKSDNRLSNLNLLSPKENVNWGTGIQRHAEAVSKPVQAFDKNTGDYAGWFKSLKESVEWLQCNGWPKASHGGISMALAGRRPSCYGFIWKYA